MRDARARWADLARKSNRVDVDAEKVKMLVEKAKRMGRNTDPTIVGK